MTCHPAPSHTVPSLRWLRMGVVCVSGWVGLLGLGAGLAHASSPAPDVTPQMLQQATEWAQKHLSPDDVPEGDLTGRILRFSGTVDLKSATDAWLVTAVTLDILP